jgi:alkaline phosphatase D
VRIGFFSCQAWESGFYTAHEGLAAEDDLDLVVCLGDYVYEYGTEDPDKEVRPDRTGANRDGEAETLADWRDKYALYHSDSRLLEVRRKFPLVAIWDDHEVENNYAADIPDPGSAPEGERRVPFLERRSNGYAAFFEHMPRLRVPATPTASTGASRSAARPRSSCSTSASTAPTSPTSPGTERECLANPACRAEARDPSRTMLGAAQKTWLKGALADSRATWKVVGNQLMIMALDATPNVPAQYDGWDGYEVERAELLDDLRAKDVRNVTFLTGDIHTFFAGDVAPDGRAKPGRLAGGRHRVRGRSISSKGIADTVGGEEAREGVAFPSDARSRSTTRTSSSPTSRSRATGSSRRAPTSCS